MASENHCGCKLPEKTDSETLKELANRIRIHSVESTSAANSGHPTTSSSVAEILAVLFFQTMRYKVDDPKDPSSDRFVLSKGHAAPAFYGAWAENGHISPTELKNLRKFTSDLEGHPTPRLDFVDVGTGSLGQGLSLANGMAYVGKYVEKADYRVYCVTGDGEVAEGAMWESIAFAGFYKLDNLVLIIDANRLGQSGQTMIGHDLEIYKNRLDAFNFHSVIVDGHDVDALVAAFEEASTVKEKPTAVVARTLKGKNFPGIEDQENWHGKPLGSRTDEVLTYLKSLSKNPDGKLSFRIPSPIARVPTVDLTKISLSSPPNYKIGDKLGSRAAYGTALVKLIQSNPRVIALDADMKNSTFSQEVQQKNPNNFIECYIGEQNMIGVAVGACCRDRTVAFASTFAAFLTRAFDQIRMGAISMSNVNICGSHCGVSIGQDGGSQMGLEDIAMFRSIPGSTVFYPADVVATERAVELAANTNGIAYIRTTRATTPVIYPNSQQFQVGKSIVISCSDKDQVLIIAGGVTLTEAMTASTSLVNLGINVRILDLFTIKPIDKEGIIKNAKEVGGRILVVEDHYPEGGIGEAVLSVIAEERNFLLKHAAIPKVPRSGSPEELFDYYGIDAKHIVEYVQEIINK